MLTSHPQLFAHFWSGPVEAQARSAQGSGGRRAAGAAVGMAPKKPLPQRSCASQLLLLWCWDLVRRGLRTELRAEDVPPVPGELLVGSLPLMHAEALLAQGQSLLAVVRACFPSMLPLGVLLGAAQGFLSTVPRTLLLHRLVRGVANGAGVTEHVLLVAALGTILLLEGVASTASRHWFSDKFCTGLFGMVAMLVHRKTLRLAPLTSAASSAGALVGNDLVRTVENWKLLSMSPMGFSQVFFGVAMVLWLAGLGGLVGVVLVLVLVAFNVALSTLIKGVEKSNLSASEVRLALMEHMIVGIKAIKLSAWEEPFLTQVLAKRDEECAFLCRYRILLQCTTQLGRMCPVVGAAICFVFLGLTGSSWNAADAFATLSVWHAMRMGLILIPNTVALLAAISAATERLRSFLLLADLGDARCRDTLQDGPQADAFAGAVAEAPCELPSIRAASCGWGDGRFSLRSLSFTLQPGELMGVAGAVGSGKSSLLLALLGELPWTQGIGWAARGAVAYIPQSPVIVSGTVIENILLGRPLEQSRLDLAIQAAVLNHDLKALPQGGQTQIGERGVLLSGGQQMRVAVARALYSKAALILADDPLAAVDSEVAAKIFDGGFRTWCGHGGAAMVVLNQPHFLDRCDRVLVMRGGCCTELPPQGGGAWREQLALSAPPATDEEAPLAPVVEEEVGSAGSVAAGVLLDYLRGMGWCLVATGSLICVGTYVAMAGADRLLAVWLRNNEESGLLQAYGALCGVFMLGMVVSSLLFSIGGVRAGRTLHHACVTHLMHAPLAWFEQTPSGRITSRFSSDLASIDLYLPYYFDNVCQFAATLLALVGLVALLVPPIVAVIVVGLGLYGLLIVAVDRTNRESKWLVNVAMAPVLTTMQEAVVGGVLLRAMRLQAFATGRFEVVLDHYNRFAFTSSSVIHFGMICSYGITVIFCVSTASAIVADLASYDDGQAGLALSYAVTVPYFLLFLSFNIYNLTPSLACLERMLQYKGDAVPQEAAWHKDVDLLLPKAWPGSGAVEFQAVELRYQPTLPPAIRGLSLSVRGGEKLGVVGRSGAGKSSLVQLLFRLRECTAGRILLDGQDIAEVGLQTMRRRLAIIPQEPLTVVGDVRRNLDPTGTHKDADLCKIILGVGLAAKGAEQAVLSRDAGSLSSGERQLVTLARALLRCVTLAVMDEPTSKVDPTTDAVVQRVVRERFSAATVITIAHRLHTIIDYDRVLVMGDGRMIECAPPRALLADPGSEFSRLVDALGGAAAAELRASAHGGDLGIAPALQPLATGGKWWGSCQVPLLQILAEAATGPAWGHSVGHSIAR